MKRATLGKRDKELLVRCAEFVLAGEWPWGGNGKRDQARSERESKRLRDAINKLTRRGEYAQTNAGGDRG